MAEGKELAKADIVETQDATAPGMVRLRYRWIGERVMRKSDFDNAGIDFGAVRFDRDNNYVAEVPEAVAEFLKMEDGDDHYEIVPDDEPLYETIRKAQAHR